MSGYALIYREERNPALTDGSALRPDELCALDRAGVAATPLRIGRQIVALGDVFEVNEANAEGELLIRNAPPLDRLGAKMTHGELIIEGDAGDDLGASMSGGVIRVGGSAGHRIGGPDRDSRRGMTGGEILVAGDAGDDAGFLMRRGLVAVAGRTGRSPGYRMLAGTIVLMQPPGDHPGLEMQRGTILCMAGRNDAASMMGSHLADEGVIAASAMPALLLVLRRLRALGWPEASRPIDVTAIAGAQWRVMSGDRFEHQRGEVLQCLA